MVGRACWVEDTNVMVMLHGHPWLELNELAGILQAAQPVDALQVQLLLDADFAHNVHLHPGTGAVSSEDMFDDVLLLKTGTCKSGSLHGYLDGMRDTTLVTANPTGRRSCGLN